MRKYLTTTLVTSLGGLIWRNRHKVLNRKQNTPTAPAENAPAAPPTGATP